MTAGAVRPGGSPDPTGGMIHPNAFQNVRRATAGALVANIGGQQPDDRRNMIVDWQKDLDRDLGGGLLMQWARRCGLVVAVAAAVVFGTGLSASAAEPPQNVGWLHTVGRGGAVFFDAD